MLDHDNTHELMLGNVGWQRGHGTMLLGPCIPWRGLGRTGLGLAMPREGELTTSFILTQDILTE